MQTIIHIHTDTHTKRKKDIYKAHVDTYTHTLDHKQTHGCIQRYTIIERHTNTHTFTLLLTYTQTQTRTHKVTHSYTYKHKHTDTDTNR